ncbi:MAG: bacteriorhodopsin [Bacteroidetes bacterium]|nr:bacteriorhodopsin [Bacteroidota bacterium]
MDLISLDPSQYSLVYNMFSFTIASMLAAFVFFWMGQQQVAPKYRISLIVSGLVVGIAAYHYFRIFSSFEHAYDAATGMFDTAGFNDAYRYVDWLLTVPLLLVELVLVMGLTKEKNASLLPKLVIASALMIALGYPGEIMAFGDRELFGAYGLWGTLSTIPFVYILYILWGELGKAMEDQPDNVRVLLRNIRLLLIGTWGFYPIVYCLPFFGIEQGNTLVAIQVGYALADVLAKAGYGVMIYAIARAKSEAAGFKLAEA